MTTLRSVSRKPKHAASPASSGAGSAANIYTDSDLTDAMLVIGVYSDGRRRSQTVADYTAGLNLIDDWTRSDKRLAVARIYAPCGHGKYDLMQDWER